jgi:hypothetical protein
MLNSKLLKNSREAKYVMPNPENVILNLALKQVQGDKELFHNFFISAMRYALCSLRFGPAFQSEV